MLRRTLLSFAEKQAVRTSAPERMTGGGKTFRKTEGTKDSGFIRDSSAPNAATRNYRNDETSILYPPVMGLEAAAVGLGRNGFVYDAVVNDRRDNTFDETHEPHATPSSALLSGRELRRMDAAEWRNKFQQTPFLRNGDYFYRNNYEGASAPHFETRTGAKAKFNAAFLPVATTVVMWLYTHDLFKVWADKYTHEGELTVESRHKAMDDAITKKKRWLEKVARERGDSASLRPVSVMHQLKGKKGEFETEADMLRD